MGRWNDIFHHLQKNGYDVYAPGTHKGECVSPYLVVKDNGTSSAPSISSNIAAFQVMVYLPENRYSELEEFVAEVEEVMKGIYPLIRPQDYKTPAYLDSEIKGWMVSIYYENYQKKERFSRK